MSAHCRNDELPHWQDVEDEQILGATESILDNVRKFMNVIIRTIEEDLDGSVRDELLRELCVVEANRQHKREYAVRRNTRRALQRRKTDIQFDFDNAKTDDEWTDQ